MLIAWTLDGAKRLIYVSLTRPYTRDQGRAAVKEMTADPKFGDGVSLRRRADRQRRFGFRPRHALFPDDPQGDVPRRSIAIVVPILFDFDKPRSKDVTGTIETLARMSRFIIANLTDPSSIPHELATIIPCMRTTPVALLRRKGSESYTMIEDYVRAHSSWVLPIDEYTTEAALIRALPEKILAPAETRANKLQGNSERRSLGASKRSKPKMAR